MPPGHLWEQIQSTKADVVAILNNKNAVTIIECNPVNKLEWNVRGPLDPKESRNSPALRKRHIESMVATVYGERYPVPCGQCASGLSNYEHCTGFRGKSGAPALSHGACSSCIQANKGQTCEWNTTSGIFQAIPTQRYEPQAFSSWQRRRDVCSAVEHYNSLNGVGSRVYYPSPYKGQAAPGSEAQAQPQPQVQAQAQQHVGEPRRAFPQGPLLDSDPDLLSYGRNDYISSRIRGLLLNNRYSDENMPHIISALQKNYRSRYDKAHSTHEREFPRQNTTEYVSLGEDQFLPGFSNQIPGGFGNQIQGGYRSSSQTQDRGLLDGGNTGRAQIAIDPSRRAALQRAASAALQRAAEDGDDDGEFESDDRGPRRRAQPEPESDQTHVLRSRRKAPNGVAGEQIQPAAAISRPQFVAPRQSTTPAPSLNDPADDVIHLQGVYPSSSMTPLDHTQRQMIRETPTRDKSDDSSLDSSQYKLGRELFTTIKVQKQLKPSVSESSAEDTSRPSESKVSKTDAAPSRQTRSQTAIAPPLQTRSQTAAAPPLQTRSQTNVAPSRETRSQKTSETSLKRKASAKPSGKGSKR